MSNINTTGIDVNYPTPGINNNSQGFRDNFASIKTNVTAAGVEITDLQNKVIVKSALANSAVNNDMAGTLLSNTLTRGFRASTYNLGNALSGTVLVDVSLGDVQYGAIAANTTLAFTGWTTDGRNSVDLQLDVSANANAFLSFPSAISSNACLGVTTLENYDSANNAVSIPAGVCEFDYTLTSIDCGANISIEPSNRPRRSTQIRQRSPAPTGLLGDIAGTVSVSSGVDQLVITGANTDPYLTTSGSTTQLYTDMPVVFTGVSLAGNLVVGTTYYVRNVVSSSTFTVSSTIGGANVAIGANAAGTTMLANPTSYVYLCTDTFNATVNTALNITNTATNGNITIGTGGGNLAVNIPIIFTGNMGGLLANTNYYVKSLSGTGAASNITVSRSRTNGIADTLVTLSANSTATTATYYVGSDIWKRIPLTSW
jgi:hypothetical protein